MGNHDSYSDDQVIMMAGIRRQTGNVTGNEAVEGNSGGEEQQGASSDGRSALQPGSVHFRGQVGETGGGTVPVLARSADSGSIPMQLPTNAFPHTARLAQRALALLPRGVGLSLDVFRWLQGSGHAVTLQEPDQLGTHLDRSAGII